MALEPHPNIQVLSRETGHDRPYGRNPYVGYDNPAGKPLLEFFSRDADPRLPAMERLVAVELGNGWAAPFERLRKAGVINEKVAGRPFSVF